VDRPWSGAETATLETLVAKGVFQRDIARALGRTPDSVKGKIDRLALASMTASTNLGLQGEGGDLCDLAVARITDRVLAPLDRVEAALIELSRAARASSRLDRRRAA
jgi:hypothetical protein